MPKIIEDEKIFEAVLKVVAERGYTGATTKQMADAAEISEMTLFRKYENKAQLVGRAVGFVLKSSEFAEAAEYSGDVRADLLRVVQAYQNMAVSYGHFFLALFSEFSRYPELSGAMEEPFGVFMRISELMARYQAEGVLHKEPPLQAVATLLAPVMYVSTIRKALGGDHLPALDFEAYVGSFLGGRSKR